MIGVYMQTGMTEEQYREVDAKIMATGVVPEGLKMHSCFGEGDQLAIFDVWETQESFESFAAHLGPIFAELGITPVSPDFVPMIDYRTAD